LNFPSRRRYAGGPALWTADINSSEAHVSIRFRAAAILALGPLALSACGPEQAPTPPEQPPPIASSLAPSEPEIDPAAIASALAEMPAPYNHADYDNGRRIFAQCRACHLIQAGAGNSVGPNLHGVFGRKAATLAGFPYSPALTASAITWDWDTLDTWLKQPAALVPNTRMTFLGLRKADDRRDVIAYLAIASNQ
jgi:cytochrome c